MSFQIDNRLVKKIEREEGFKNPEDTHELFNVDAGDRLAERLREIRLNVADFPDEGKLSFEMLRLLKKVEEFIREITYEVSEKFIESLKDYNNSKGKIPESVAQYILSKDLISPVFRVADKESGEEQLKKYGFLKEKIESGNFLLNLQLPKPIAQFWFKQESNYRKSGILSEKKKYIPPGVEWGYFYAKIMPVIWKVRDRWGEEENIFFNRINAGGNHSRNHYYYLWEISDHPFPELEEEEEDTTDDIYNE